MTEIVDSAHWDFPGRTLEGGYASSPEDLSDPD